MQILLQNFTKMLDVGNLSKLEILTLCEVVFVTFLNLVKAKFQYISALETKLNVKQA